MLRLFGCNQTEPLVQDVCSTSYPEGQQLQQPLASTSRAHLTGPPGSEQVPGQPHPQAQGPCGVTYQASPDLLSLKSGL